LRLPIGAYILAHRCTDRNTPVADASLMHARPSFPHLKRKRDRQGNLRLFRYGELLCAYSVFLL
jgi:hypothetical protein